MFPRSNTLEHVERIMNVIVPYSLQGRCLNSTCKPITLFNLLIYLNQTWKVFNGLLSPTPELQLGPVVLDVCILAALRQNQ